MSCAPVQIGAINPTQYGGSAAERAESPTGQCQREITWMEWVRQHWILAGIICFVAANVIVAKVYPPYEEKVLKRILAGISIVLVAATYLTVFALTALSFKVLRRRLLPNDQRRNDPTYWTKREKTEPTLDYLKRQF